MESLQRASDGRWSLGLPPGLVDLFEVFRQRFAYDRTDLDVRIESRQETNEHWIHEAVSYDAAHGGERIPAHLFLARNASPPYQTVIYFPGAGAVF